MPGVRDGVRGVDHAGGVRPARAERLGGVHAVRKEERRHQRCEGLGGREEGRESGCSQCLFRCGERELELFKFDEL